MLLNATAGGQISTSAWIIQPYTPGKSTIVPSLRDT